MQKIFVLFCFFSFAAVSVFGQDKTKLSLQVSAATAANRAQLKNYVWTRTVQVFVSGTLKNTIVSSISVGPDGNMVTTAVSSVATDPPPTKGIRGALARKKIDEIKTYVDNAVKVSTGYIYMNKGDMVNYFDAATISQSGSTISIVGSNVKQTNDQFTMNVKAGSLALISESFKSTASGDAIEGSVSYKTFANGLTAFNNGELDLPAKDMKLMIVNTNYAKKLQ